MTALLAQKISVTTTEGKPLLTSISFEQTMGSVLGVFGPNGSGKTTLLKKISGFQSDHQVIGDFWIGSQAISSALTPSERMKKIIYLGSDFHSPFELTVRELFEMGALAGVSSLWPELGSVERARISEIVESLSLIEFLPRLFGTLSDGEKQLMMFARALIQSPEVLVLDESFSKLDLDHLLLIARELRRRTNQGMTFLVSSHDLNFLSEISDDLLLLRKSNLVIKGKVIDVLTPHYLGEIYPGVSLQVVRSPETGKLKVLY